MLTFVVRMCFRKVVVSTSELLSAMKMTSKPSQKAIRRAVDGLFQKDGSFDCNRLHMFKFVNDIESLDFCDGDDI